MSEGLHGRDLGDENDWYKKWSDQVEVKAGRWAERTLLFSSEMRHTFFISLVKQGRPKDRHIDHWVEDCIDLLAYNAREALLWGFESEDIRAYAYMKTYESVLKGHVPRKGFYKRSQLAADMAKNQYTPKVMVSWRRSE